MNEKDLIEWLEDRGELMVMKKDGEGFVIARDVEDCRGGNFGSGDNFMGGSVMFKFLRNRAKVEAILNKKGK